MECIGPCGIGLLSCACTALERGQTGPSCFALTLAGGACGLIRQQSLFDVREGRLPFTARSARRTMTAKARTTRQTLRISQKEREDSFNRFHG